MHIQKKSLYLARVAADLAALLAAFLLSIFIRSKPINFLISYDFLFISLAFILVFSTLVTGLYDEYRSRSFAYEVMAILKNVLIQMVSAIVILFFSKISTLSRQFILVYSMSLFFSLVIEKYLMRIILNHIRRKGKNSRSVLIIGAGEIGEKFFRSIEDNPHYGYRLVGVLDDTKRPFLNGQYKGKVENLEEVLSTKKIDDVILTLNNYPSEKLESVIETCDRYTVKMRITPDILKYSPKYTGTMFGKFPMLSVRSDQLNQMRWRLIKRVFDIVFTLAAFLFIFSWLWPIIFICQKIFNPGPVFYRARRWGRNGEEFLCYKFRSMTVDSNNIDESGKHQHTSKIDPRITKFGRILRKTNFDELPQFINVLKGEMSIVGPRPHDVKENMEIKDIIRGYMWRHICKPGLTGWAAVHGYRGGTHDIELMQKRTELDNWYIENWTFYIDLQVIFLTIWKMIKGDPNAY